MILSAIITEPWLLNKTKKWKIQYKNYIFKLVVD